MPYKLSQRLTPEAIAELIAVYEAGASTRELAERMGICTTSVKNLLKEYGIRARRQSPTAAEVQQAVALFREGQTMKEIGQQLGFGTSTISRALARVGITTRSAFEG